MTVARNVAEAISKHVTPEVECVDRAVSDLYQPLLQTPADAACFFRNVRHRSVRSPTLKAPVPRAVAAEIEALAERGNIDLIRIFGPSLRDR